MTQTVSTDAPILLDTYALQDAGEVQHFVAERPHLWPLLEEAPARIREFFPDAPLSLEVAHDPAEPGHPALFIYVHVDLDGRVAFDTLKQLDAVWWLERSRQARNEMEISLEWL